MPSVRTTAPNSTPFPSRTRRVRVEREHSPLALMSAIPRTHRPPKHAAEWVRTALQHPAIDTLRTDARARMHRFIHLLATLNQPRSRTILTTWEALAQKLNICRRTVANMLRRLRDAELLTVVATGRSAARTPKATGRTRNEAPVYALMVEGQLEGAPHSPDEADSGVDVSCTPDPVGRDIEHMRARTREANPTWSRFAARSFERQRAARAAFHARTAHRPLTEWSRHATMEPMTRLGSRRARKQAIHDLALALQVHAPDTRGATTAGVASAIRPFMLAGWSVADVMHALDWSPQGDKHLGGASGCLRVEVWLTKRLALWTQADEPIRPFSQRVEARRAEDRARAAAQRERDRRSAASATAAPADFRRFRAVLRDHGADEAFRQFPCYRPTA